jgi:hypothetical protein
LKQSSQKEEETELQIAKNIIDDLSMGDVVYTDFHNKQYWDTTLTHSYYNILSPYYYLKTYNCINKINTLNKPYRAIRPSSINYSLFQNICYQNTNSLGTTLILLETGAPYPPKIYIN